MRFPDILCPLSFAGEILLPEVESKNRRPQFEEARHPFESARGRPYIFRCESMMGLEPWLYQSCNVQKDLLCGKGGRLELEGVDFQKRKKEPHTRSLVVGLKRDTVVRSFEFHREKARFLNGCGSI